MRRYLVAVLEDTARDFFAVLGVHFVAQTVPKGWRTLGRKMEKEETFTLSALSLEEDYDDRDVDIIAMDFSTGRVGRSRVAIGVEKTELDTRHSWSFGVNVVRHAARPIPFLLDEPSEVFFSSLLQVRSGIRWVFARMRDFRRNGTWFYETLKRYHKEDDLSLAIFIIQDATFKKFAITTKYVYTYGS